MDNVFLNISPIDGFDVMYNAYTNPMNSCMKIVRLGLPALEVMKRF